MEIQQISSMGDWGRLQPIGYCRQLPAVGIGEPTPPIDVKRNHILLGDAVDQLRGLPSSAVDCMVTSPPYYGLRNYGIDGQIGLEDNVHGWVRTCVE